MTPQRAGEVFWSLPNLAMITQGSWLRRPSSQTCPNTPPSTIIRGLSIDTRTLQPGQAYLALKGENHDGHAFLQKALDAGASLLIIDNPDSIKDLEGIELDASSSSSDDFDIPATYAFPVTSKNPAAESSDSTSDCNPESLISTDAIPFPDPQQFAPEAQHLASSDSTASLNTSSPNSHTNSSEQSSEDRNNEQGSSFYEVAILLVDNTLTALQTLARAWRDVLGDCNNKVIAVAGSNGKTSTRHLIHSLIHGRMVSLDRSPANTGELTPPKHKLPVPNEERPDLWRLHQVVGTQSPKSFNNHIGVPLTLLAAKAEDDFTVVEVGTNHPGEVDALGRIIEPDAAVITSIGREHLEFFGDLEGVAKEEAALLAHLKPGGVIVIEQQAAKLIAPYAKPPTNHHRITYGKDNDASLMLQNFMQFPDGISFDVMLPGQKKLGPVNVPLIGYHNAINLLAAIGIAKWMGIDDIQLNLGFMAISPAPGRLQPIVYEDTNTTVIHDAYNANPDSLSAAFDVIESLAASSQGGSNQVIGAISPSEGGGQKFMGSGFVGTATREPCTIVLGDMLELGEHEKSEHQAAADRVREFLERGLLTVAVFAGPRMCQAAQELKSVKGIGHRVHLYPDWPKNPTALAVAKGIMPGQTILLKASNGMKLSTLIDEFDRKFTY
ncbi:UDP-N-acetylmuramoyl-tripeptide--D-alanyl-D-alanine ligase [Planctomycetota bacterium]|nr:UDP-N-acetylmuramoyl-tripeptide--D-alanyl-D-alanine ligase [Planctomycetota bacterium]